MKCFWCGIFFIHMANALIEKASSTVHIQNYEGPIYVSPGECVTTNNQYPCTTTRHPTCDDRYPSTTYLQPACDSRYPSTTILQPNCDSRYPSTTILQPNCDNRYPPTTNIQPNCDFPCLYNNNQGTILHNSVSQTVCETDCKCVTKQHNCVPVAVNSVPQSACNTRYYSSQYPEGYYGYVCPETCYPTDVSLPKVSETVIPLLNTYLGQVGQCGHQTCSKCGRQHSF